MAFKNAIGFTFSSVFLPCACPKSHAAGTGLFGCLQAKQNIPLITGTPLPFTVMLPGTLLHLFRELLRICKDENFFHSSSLVTQPSLKTHIQSKVFEKEDSYSVVDMEGMALP